MSDEQILRLLELQRQHDRSALIGTAGGRVRNARAVDPDPPRGEVIYPAGGGGGVAFNMNGPIVVFTFDPWPMTEARSFSTWGLSLTIAGTTDTLVQILKNGATMTTLTLPATQNVEVVTFGLSAVVADLVTAAIVSVGAGAAGLTVVGT